MTIKTTIFTNCPRVSLARFSFCWWRHNWLLMTSQWPDNCDAIKWIMISNSLDIDFIHSDIHGQSCKKNDFMNKNDKYMTMWGHRNIYCITSPLWWISLVIALTKASDGKKWCFLCCYTEQTVEQRLCFLNPSFVSPIYQCKIYLPLREFPLDSLHDHF